MSKEKMGEPRIGFCFEKENSGHVNDQGREYKSESAWSEQTGFVSTHILLIVKLFKTFPLYFLGVFEKP